MIYNLYCVKDEKVEFQSDLVSHINDELAVHSFGSSLVHSSPVFGRFEDYSLYCVGTFDSSSGIVTNCEPRFITHGLNARELAIKRIKSLNLESEVFPNGDGDMVGKTE